MKPLSLLMLTSLALAGCGANNSPPKTPFPAKKPLPKCAPSKPVRK
jgi:uncharacterized protein YcfL